MDVAVKWLAELTEIEYRGKSWNGRSLIDTLRGYTLGQVSSKDTYEKFTVWGVVLHNVYWKWKLLRVLTPGDTTPYDYELKNFPVLPEPADAAAWDKTLSDSDAVHDAYMAALNQVSVTGMEEMIPDWDCTVGAAIGWMATHDSYHVAQIRNMAVPGAL